MPITPFSGTFGRQEIIHLLKRTTFGAKKSDIDFYTGKSLAQTVDELLDTTEPAPSPPLKEYTNADVNNGDTSVATGTTWLTDISNTDNTVNNFRRASYKKWWIGLMLNQAPTIREKLTLFWINYFGNEAQVVRFAVLLYQQSQLLRSNCMGNFKDMVRNMSIDPAMLVYLNGYLNNKFAPDENYARELMELFTLGKDDAVNYNETDVQTAARILTGWSIDGSTAQNTFNSVLHDNTDKQFSAYFSNTIIPGDSSNNGGINELNLLLDMIFLKDEVAKYLIRRLYRFFVYYEITPQVETDVIVPLANTLRSNNYEIRPVLVELFNSQHFFDTNISQGAIIKAPVDMAIGAFREFNVQYPNSTDYATNYAIWAAVGQSIISMNQDIHEPPNVAGWPAYYQEPGFHELWINSNTLTFRNQFTDFILYVGANINGFRVIVDPIAFAESLSNPSDPNQLIADSVEMMYRIELSQDARDAIKTDILLSGQTDDSYWTSYWLLYQSDPGNATYEAAIKSRLQALYKHLMNLEEYQLS